MNSPDSLSAKIAYKDTISLSSITAYDYVSSNAEETADVFSKIPGINILDLGELGQFSGVSYRGTGYGNVVPVLNGIPLDSETFGSYNWLDIPFFAIKRAHFSQTAQNKNPGIFCPVLIETNDNVGEIPFSRVNYRIGELGWNHSDFTISRRLSEKTSFYGTGSTEHYTGNNISQYGDRYTGSNVWIDFRHKPGSWSFRWNILISDKNFSENMEILNNGLNTDKSVRHSKNTKFVSLFSTRNNLPFDLNARFYLWQIKDRADGSAVYNGYYSNVEKTAGAILGGSLIKSGHFNSGFKYHFKASETEGPYFGFDDTLLRHNFSMNFQLKFSDGFRFNFAPELNTYSDIKNADYLGRVENEIHFTKHLKSVISASYTARYPNSIMNLFEKEMTTEYQESYDLNIIFHSDKFLFNVNPFNITLVNPFVYKLWSKTLFGREFKGVDQNNNSDFSYSGISTGMVFKPGKHFEISGHYTFIFDNNNQQKLYMPKHNAYMKISLLNLEDYIMSRNLNTEISVIGNYWNQRYSLNYYPIYQQFSISGTKIPDALYLKARASANIESITLFYEIDFLNKSDFQFVSGYPVRKRMIRMGVEWNFYN